jgi:hypothetical protein
VRLLLEWCDLHTFRFPTVMQPSEAEFLASVCLPIACSYMGVPRPVHDATMVPPESWLMARCIDKLYKNHPH